MSYISVSNDVGNSNFTYSYIDLGYDIISNYN